MKNGTNKFHYFQISEKRLLYLNSSETCESIQAKLTKVKLLWKQEQDDKETILKEKWNQLKRIHLRFFEREATKKYIKFIVHL